MRNEEIAPDVSHFTKSRCQNTRLQTGTLLDAQFSIDYVRGTEVRLSLELRLGGVKNGC